MKRICTLIAALFFATAAHAQSAGTVTLNAFAIGKGPNVTGYTSLLCGSAQLAVGQAAASPICRTVSGDATLSAAGALTLATVNSNVGTFGSATNCPAVTVDGKGRVTAASQTACTPAIANVTGLGTNVAAWLATPSSANLRAAMTDETGTALLYFQGGDLGTPTAGVGTNLTALNASNLSSGTVAAARGGAGTINGVLAGNGAGAVSQGTCGGLSGVAASCATDATNATNIASGTLAVARGGVDQTSWAAYTPTCAFTTPGTSVIGAVAGRQKVVGKTQFFTADCTVTTVGTGTGSLTISVPTAAFSASAVYTATGNEVITLGALVRVTNASVSTVNVLKYDNSSLALGGNGTRVQIGGFYELP